MMKWIDDKEEKKRIASDILYDLPEWFGLPDSTREYIECAREYPFYAALQENKPVGFLVLKKTGNATLELYVMGVRKEYQHQGIGKQLVQKGIHYAREHGFSFLQVKTVKMGHDPEYDATNAFYQKMGFQELECFPELWDAHNPCQIYIQSIEKQ